MHKRLKLVVGVLFCLLGLIILTSSIFLNRFIPGGFICLGIGIILLTDSKGPDKDRSSDERNH